ncbi:MAG: hypothetical protein OXG96_04460 [Acidobacteria bacterium]|nr:hypothetical protein [Acidobacteriota bacterium]
MSKKSFQNVPRPQLLTDRSIEAFERSGPGHAAAGFPTPVEIRAEPKKRLSIDLPASTHRRFKTACSATGRKMVSEIRGLIEARLVELEREI